MEATASRIDVLQECHFARPSFDMAKSGPEVMKTFYNVISPRFKMGAEQLSVVPSTTLSDVAIRFSLFDNAAVLEVKPQKMSLLATRIQDTQGLLIIKELLKLAYQAKEQALPDIGLSTSRFLVNSWLRVEGDAKDALAAVSTPVKPMLGKGFGPTAEVIYNLNTKVSESRENWELTIREEPSALPNSDLFLSLEFWFSPASKYATPASQIEFVEEMFRSTMRSLGMEPKESAS